MAGGRTKCSRRCGVRSRVVWQVMLKRGYRLGCMIPTVTLLPSQMAAVEATRLARLVTPQIHSDSPPLGPIAVSVRTRKIFWVKQTTPIEEGLSILSNRVSSYATFEAPTRTKPTKRSSFFRVRNITKIRHSNSTILITNSTDKLSCTFRGGSRIRF